MTSPTEGAVRREAPNPRLPFLVLGAAIALGGLARIAAVTAIVALVGGLGTWLGGPENTVNIGARGIVFGSGAYVVVRVL